MFRYSSAKCRCLRSQWISNRLRRHCRSAISTMDLHWIRHILSFQVTAKAAYFTAYVAVRRSLSTTYTAVDWSLLLRHYVSQLLEYVLVREWSQLIRACTQFIREWSPHQRRILTHHCQTNVKFMLCVPYQFAQTRKPIPFLRYSYAIF